MLRRTIDYTNPYALDENFLLNSRGERNGENERKIPTLPAPGIEPGTSRSHARQVSEPLHYGGGLANHKNVLIHRRASGESRLIRAPCITRAVSLSKIWPVALLLLGLTKYTNTLNIVLIF